MSRHLYQYVSCFLVMGVLLNFSPVTVIAKSNDFQINYLNVVKLDDELRLDAEIKYELNDEVVEALANGISIKPFLKLSTLIY